MGIWWGDVIAEENELWAGYGNGGDAPQYVALRLDKGAYLRLNCGPGTDWGTSAALLPFPWLEGAKEQDQDGQILRLKHGQDGEDYLIEFEGSASGLDCHGKVRVVLAGNGAVLAYVDVKTSGRRLPLEPGRGLEAFKYAFLSSMKVSDREWDASSAYVGGTHAPIPGHGEGFIIPLGTGAHRFGTLGGHSDWQRRNRNVPVPGVEVFSRNPMAVGGWLTRKVEVSTGVWRDVCCNDDNVGLWAGSDRVLPEWSYMVACQA